MNQRITPDGKKRVLIIKTGYGETLDSDNSGVVSLGDILRTTVILHLYPSEAYHVTWLVDPKGAPLLRGNPMIHRLLTVNHFTPHLLLSESFDIVINFEKDPGICSVADRIPAWRRFGFRLESWTHDAVSYDHSDEALAMTYDMDVKKRKQKSWSDVLYEMVGHVYQGQPYVLGYQPQSKSSIDVGLNHQIGKKFPLKRWPEESWNRLGKNLSRDFSVSWQQGTKDIEGYFEWISSCRMLVTNDSLGLHIALGLGKPVVALFGPTIASELDYPGLVKLTPSLNWDCIPCLESKCIQDSPCMNFIDVKEVIKEVHGLLTVQESSLRYMVQERVL